MKEYLQALYSTKQSTQKIHNIIKTFSCLPLENAIYLGIWLNLTSFGLEMIALSIYYVYY